MKIEASKPSALNDLESNAAREDIVPFWTVLNLIAHTQSRRSQ